MRHSSGENFIQLAGFCFFFGGALLWDWQRRMRRSRKIEDTARVPVASAAQGHAELHGYAWPIQTLSTLLSGKTAVYRSLKIEKNVRRGKRSHWVTIYEEKSERPFYLVDSSGMALIYPPGAEIECQCLEKAWFQLGDEQRLTVNELLRTHGVDVPMSWGFWIFSSLRITERWIDAGSPLLALGQFRSGQDSLIPMKSTPMRGLGQFLEKVQKLSRPEFAAFILDKNRDGVISAEEHHDGVVAAASLSTGTYGSRPIVIPKGGEKSPGFSGQMTHSTADPLFISDHHEKGTLERLLKWNFLRLIAGAAAISTGVILVYLQMR